MTETLHLTDPARIRSAREAIRAVMFAMLPDPEDPGNTLGKLEAYELVERARKDPIEGIYLLVEFVNISGRLNLSLGLVCATIANPEEWRSPTVADGAYAAVRNLIDEAIEDLPLGPSRSSKT